MKILSAALAVVAMVALTTVVVAAPTSEGEQVYESACAACHGANGKGALPGVPDFTKKGGVLANSNDVLMQRVIAGYQSPGSPMAMPAKGGNPALGREQVQAAVQYVRQTFGRR